MNTRRRTCGAPMEHADTIDHSASYPILAKSPRTVPIPRSSSAATFSTTTYLGRSSPMRREKDDHRPDRSPPIPAPAPAWLMSWHGNPPQMTSQGTPAKVVTSPWIGTAGQCLRRMAWQYGLFSTNWMVRIPARSSPRLKPPIPEKRSRTFTEAVRPCGYCGHKPAESS